MSQHFALDKVWFVKADPTVTSVNAPKGSLLVYAPVVGTPQFFQKTDDGDTTNWTNPFGVNTWNVVGNILSGLLPTTPNEFFGSNNDYDVVEKRNGIEYLRFAVGGTNLNTLAYQFVYATNSFLFGNNATGVLQASGVGSLAHGTASATANITATGAGSDASGVSDAAGSLITASGIGAQARGSATANSQISALADGSVARGSVGTTGTILANGVGASAYGLAVGGATISATADGALAQGSASGAGGAVSASGIGSTAKGFAPGVAITASAAGSYACGSANTGAITASGVNSFAHGDLLTVSANFGASFGLGNNVSSFACFTIGRYALPTVFTPAAWVSTEPVFVIGNGTGVGSEATAYQLDKDGRQTTTASRVDQGIRIVAAAGAISARTDYAIVCDTTGVTGNLTLPAGEKGLEFVFTTKGAGAAVYTLVANGGDLFDVSVAIVIATGTISRIKFLGGTWYAV